MPDHIILALDQGTTSTRAVIFDDGGEVLASATRPLAQIYPQAGWVAHEASGIFTDAIAVIRDVLQQTKGNIPRAMGITNQRETVLLWDRVTGEPISNAIVWQDRRTADYCKTLRDSGFEAEVSAKTGLLLDPYFSATKIAWILENIEFAKERALNGDLLAGTIDCWLLWKLTGGKTHATDATNASRTMLVDIHTGKWDRALLEKFEIPAALLPDIVDCQGNFGVTDGDLVGAEIPITGIVGDQQAAAYGQCCFEPGSIKATFGTGGFILVNTGDKAIVSENRLLSTILSQISGQRRYALEGSLFMAGATIQWLRDNLGIIENAADTEDLARAADPDSGVFLVPAFQGLGAPHWDADARAIIGGMTRGTGRAEIARAALEGVAFQVRDLMVAINDDLRRVEMSLPQRLKVDGAMSRNNWFLQYLADILDMPVDRARQSEATALGAAFHAGLAVGIYKTENECAALWRRDRTFEPGMGRAERDRRVAGWRRALERSFSNDT